MNNKLIKGISSCALAAMLLSTGAAAQTATQDNAAVSTENISFSGCVEKIRSVYTERYPEQIDIVNGVIDDVTSDKTFLEYYEYEGKTAFRILEDTLMDALTPTVEAYNFHYGVYFSYYTVPAIEQINNTYCGVAATQMALIGNGFLSNTADNRSSTKQAEIANGMTLVGNSATTDGIITYMNKYYSKDDYATYRKKLFTSFTYDKTISYLTYALRSNAIPIVYIGNTNDISYYKKENVKGYEHFVAISSVDTVNKTITVVDPFHLSGDSAEIKRQNKAFFGEHTITYDDLFAAAKGSNIWMAVFTYDSGKYNEYIY